MKSITRNLLLISSLALVAVVGLRAEPVTVSYTVTGTSGDYTLNFSVTNNISPGQHLYFFGTKLGGAGITNSPSGWDPYAWSIWNPAAYSSGPNINFNNNWINFGYTSGALLFGETLSGFSVHILDAEVPEFVDWFAYSYGDSYDGPFDFNNNWNPGFTNAAHQTQASTPDAASTLGLLGAAFAGLALLRRRFVK